LYNRNLGDSDGRVRDAVWMVCAAIFSTSVAIEKEGRSKDRCGYRELPQFAHLSCRRAGERASGRAVELRARCKLCKKSDCIRIARESRNAQNAPAETGLSLA
jgi:hypothetical protein